MPSTEVELVNGLPNVPPNWQSHLAAQFYRMKLASEAAGLAQMQEARRSTNRLVQLNQNRAFGLMPDAGLQELEPMSGGGIHVGDVYMQQPAAALPAPQPQASSSNPLAKLALGAVAAVAGLGAGLGLPQLMKDPPPVVEPVVTPSEDTDTIGVLEPDRVSP